VSPGAGVGGGVIIPLLSSHHSHCVGVIVVIASRFSQSSWSLCRGRCVRVIMAVMAIMSGLLGLSCQGHCSHHIVVVAVIMSESLGLSHQGHHGCRGHLIVMVTVVIVS
jgi:hypothetical protein